MTKTFFLGKKAQNLGMSFLTFIILFNNLIPISLTVTLEVQSNDKNQHFSLLGNTVLRCYCYRQLTDESLTDYRQITDRLPTVSTLLATRWPTLRLKTFG